MQYKLQMIEVGHLIATYTLDPGTDLQLSVIYGDIPQRLSLSGSVALDGWMGWLYVTRL
jgi:hypothetical protein